MTDNASAGATPAAGGATPPQTPAQPAAATPAAASSPAMGGDEAALGDAGKRALQAERDARAIAIRERDELKARLEELENASKSDHEKAIAQAKRDGAAEVTGRYENTIRVLAVRSALAAAGVNPAFVDLASRADVFTALKVNGEGEVQGIDDAVKALRDATPDLFVPKSQQRPTDFGGGPRGAPATGGLDMNTLIRRAAGRA